jgi:ribosomal protein S18 acetylase RimI-like enzyme
MSVADSIFRLADYCRRHGVAGAIRRAGLAGKRALFASRMVVFYCDLTQRQLSAAAGAEALRVLRVEALRDLGTANLSAMTSFWNPKVANRRIRERFEKGASLWLVQCGEHLAGYGWTMQGGTIEPYYFPLAQEDVHLFDFHVFPAYRGRGINPFLVCSILDHLATGCGGRAFIETNEWNEAQLASLRKTPFRNVGAVRCFTFLGRTAVFWATKRPSINGKGAEAADEMLRIAK